MSKETMSLKMQILASGSQAIGEIERVTKSVRAAGGDLNKIGGIASKGMNLFLAPLKIGAGLAITYGAALAALGIKAINAAAADEVLVQRLAAVYGSGKKAAAVFKELEAIGRISPIKTEALVDTVFTLKQFGLASKQNLGILAATARAANMPIEELAQNLAIMQMRGLKKFGITLESGAGSSEEATVIKYRDRMGRIRKIVAKDSEEARKDLLKIFQMKFGGDFNTNTLSGLKAVFGNLVEQSFAHVGDAMLPAAKEFFKAMNAEMKTFIESGTAEAWGKKAGAWMTAAVDKIIAGWQTMQTISGQIRDNWNKAGGGIGGIISTAITGGISFLLTTMFRTLGASMDIWMGIGKILGAAIMEQVLQMPAMGWERERQAKENYEKMDLPALRRLFPEIKTTNVSKEWIGRWANSLPDKQARLATAGAGDYLTNAVRGMGTIAPELMTGMQADMAAYRAEMDAALVKAGITPMTPLYEDNLTRRESARYAQENPGIADYFQGREIKNKKGEVVAHKGGILQQRAGYMPGAQSWYLAQQAQRSDKGYNTMYGPQINNQPWANMGTAKSMMIHIENLSVQANDAEQFVQSLQYNARSPVLAAAGI